MAILALAQAAPALPPRLTLVIAETDRQDDPRPLPCASGRGCGDSLYRSTFRGARAVAGLPLPSEFEARLRLHTPLIARSTLAMIVEPQPDGSLLVLRRTGFNGRTGIACFDDPEEPEVDWNPAAAPIRRRGDTLCVFDSSQIDPAAPQG